MNRMIFSVKAESLSNIKSLGGPKTCITLQINASATMCALVLIGMASTKMVISHVATNRYMKATNP